MVIEVRSREYYLEVINNIHAEVVCQLENEGKDSSDFDFGHELDMRFDYTEEIIVGYYLMYYDDEALKMWEYNSSFGRGLVFDTDEGVHYILKKIFENGTQN